MKHVSVYDFGWLLELFHTIGMKTTWPFGYISHCMIALMGTSFQLLLRVSSAYYLKSAPFPLLRNQIHSGQSPTDMPTAKTTLWCSYPRIPSPLRRKSADFHSAIDYVFLCSIYASLRVRCGCLCLLWSWYIKGGPPQQESTYYGMAVWNWNTYIVQSRQSNFRTNEFWKNLKHEPFG